MVADGAILRVQQAADYLEVEHHNDDELIADLIEEAEGALQGYLQVPITAAQFTEYHDGGTAILFLDRHPVQDGTVVVTDTQGTTDDATDDEVLATTEYRVYNESGMVLKTTSNGMRSTWNQGRQRFKVVYTAGLDQHPNWDTGMKAELRGSLRDLVAEWYVNRHPGAVSVNEGAGLTRTGFQTTTSWLDASLPPRVREVWDRYAEILG